MSKAFDTVNRRILLEDLQNTLAPDEIHLLAILTNRPNISIFLDGEAGEGFNTNVGICQGDCLSAVLFIYYLSHTLRQQQVDQAPLNDLKTILDVFYADDLTYASETTGDREEIKKDVPSKLKSYNLFVNLGKTEEGEAPDKRPLHLLLLQTKIQALGYIGPLSTTSVSSQKCSLLNPPTKK